MADDPPKTKPCLGGCGRQLPYRGPGRRVCTACHARNAGLSLREAGAPRGPRSDEPPPRTRDLL